MRKLLCVPILLLFLLAFAPGALGQALQTGQETTVFYSGSNIPIVPPNTPALSLAGPAGTNTFIIPLSNPSTSIRFYVTNNTANVCNGAFTATLWAASDQIVSSFNNNLTNWQIIPLQSNTGLVSTLTLNIPSSSVLYFSSAAISSPRVALQLVNTSSSCNTTNIEVTGVVTNLAVTSPLITATTGNISGGLTSNVQGIGPVNSNGAVINPVLTAGVIPPVNSGVTAVGFDNVSTTSNFIFNLSTGIVTEGVVPSTQQSTEFAVAVEVFQADNTQPPLQFPLLPWQCAFTTTSNCGNGSPQISVSFLANATSGTPLRRRYDGALSGGNNITMITTWTGTAPAVRAWTGCGGSPCAMNPTPAGGSTLLVAIECATINPCTVGTPTDTQSHTFVPVSSLTFNNAFTKSGLYLFLATSTTTAGANSVSFSTLTGSIAAVVDIEITGTSPALLSTPTISAQADQLGNMIVRQDAQGANQFSLSQTISTNTTTQIVPAITTINGVPVRIYVTDVILDTTTAGTATSIQLKFGTGSNCGTGTGNLSAVTYADTAVSGAAPTINTFRIPYQAPLNNAVCATQAGTTPGTVIVELHGFYAP